MRIQLHLSITNLHNRCPASSNRLFPNDIVQNDVNVLWQILNQQWESILNAVDDLQHEGQRW